MTSNFGHMLCSSRGTQICSQNFNRTSYGSTGASYQSDSLPIKFCVIMTLSLHISSIYMIHPMPCPVFPYGISSNITGRSLILEILAILSKHTSLPDRRLMLTGCNLQHRRQPNRQAELTHKEAARTHASICACMHVQAHQLQTHWKILWWQCIKLMPSTSEYKYKALYLLCKH